MNTPKNITIAPVQPRLRRPDHFTFKRFHIDQAGCGMKVSSDACLLGAIVPVHGAPRILDIGTGTGLLALMVAQRADANAWIDAVELCPHASLKARQNIAASEFAERIRVHNAPIERYAPAGGLKYHIILANPPFHAAGPSYPDRPRTLARAAGPTGLTFAGLAAAVDRLLLETGMFWALLPAQRESLFLSEAAARQLFTRVRIGFSHRPMDKINRVIIGLSRGPGPCTLRLIPRCDEAGAPSPIVRTLLQDYMLYY